MKARKIVSPVDGGVLLEPDVEELPSADDLRKRRLVLKNAYSRVFAGPDGEAVLDDLKRLFHDGSTIRLMQGQNGGRAVDPNGTLTASGAREVLIYILQQIG